MPHDAARLDETRSWLNKASKDLRAAAHDLQAAPPLLEDVDFHCQQAAEKVLKGFLVWHEKPFRKTHSLEEIGEQCLEIDVSGKWGRWYFWYGSHSAGVQGQSRSDGGQAPSAQAR